jgi:murein DD-endopeptidase MepM/ murein hydrolase activator NlpD
MPSQALGFAEVIAGGILLTAGIGGSSIRDVLKGKGGKIKPFLGASSGGGSSGGGSSPASIHFNQNAGAIANPLPGWSRSRIDQGVDFYGGRRILAPEAGTVVSTGAVGWPEGGGVLLHTVKGAYIYIYEGVDAIVKAGDRVTAGQEIATGRPGGSIEVGFANASGEPLSHTEYYEGKVTVWGRKAARWLNLLGAPR